eukprot:scaffold1098_cov417-Prasinococcus_capsulatus_cf.AAC.8
MDFKRWWSAGDGQRARNLASACVSREGLPRCRPLHRHVHLLSNACAAPPLQTSPASYKDACTLGPGP